MTGDSEDKALVEGHNVPKWLAWGLRLVWECLLECLAVVVLGW